VCLIGDFLTVLVLLKVLSFYGVLVGFETTVVTADIESCEVAG